jgi:hypothetical protein
MMEVNRSMVISFMTIAMIDVKLLPSSLFVGLDAGHGEMTIWTANTSLSQSESNANPNEPGDMSSAQVYHSSAVLEKVRSQCS